MVTAPGPAGIGEDQDLLGAVHECLGFSNIGTRGSRLELLAPVAPDDQAAASAGHFGDLVNPEPFDDRIKRGGDWRQRAKLLDHPVARGERRVAQHRRALFVDHRLGARIAILVSEHRHQPDREALGEVVDHVFARAKVDLERFAFCIGQVGEAPVEHGFGSRDKLHHRRIAVGKCGIDRREQARQLHREQQLRKEALFGAFEHRERGCLGP